MTSMEEREKARFELQERIDAAKAQAERNRLGQFATPPKLASDIVAYAVSLLSPRLKIRFLEPGFGTGPFYYLVQATTALILVLALGAMAGRWQHGTLILAGVIVSAFLSSLISLVKFWYADSISTIVFWIMGSFSARGWAHLLFALPYILGGSIILVLYARELNLLALGDAAAQQLGLPVSRVRLILLLAASLITAGAVAVSGIIGFVGLIVPHLMRLVVGPDHRRLLPASALAGAALLILADTVARGLLPYGQEIPVGIITALIGGPFFCYLLKVTKGQALL